MAFMTAPTTTTDGGDRLPILKFDARAGRLFTMNRSQAADGTWLTQPTDITMSQPPFCVDFGTLEVGWAHFAPGGAPLFFGPRAMEKLAGRKTKPISYTWDMNLVGDYWGWNGTRSYHHTGCVSTWYAMREALALVSLLFFFWF